MKGKKAAPRERMMWKAAGSRGKQTWVLEAWLAEEGVEAIFSLLIMDIKSILLTKSVQVPEGVGFIMPSLVPLGKAWGYPPTEWLQNHTRRNRPPRSGLMRSPSGKVWV